MARPDECMRIALWMEVKNSCVRADSKSSKFKNGLMDRNNTNTNLFETFKERLNMSSFAACSSYPDKKVVFS